MKNRFLYLAVSLTTFIPIAASAQQSSQCTGAQAVGGTCDQTEFVKSLNSIIDTVFYVIGTIAVLILLVGAIRYITSTGDATRIKQAKDTILYALFGIILAIVARAIVAFVISGLA